MTPGCWKKFTKNSLKLCASNVQRKEEAVFQILPNPVFHLHGDGFCLIRRLILPLQRFQCLQLRCDFKGDLPRRAVGNLIFAKDNDRVVVGVDIV